MSADEITQIRLEYDREINIIREKSITDFLIKVKKFTSNTYKDEFIKWLNENKLMLSVDYTDLSINQLKDVFDARPVRHKNYNPLPIKNP